MTAGAPRADPYFRTGRPPKLRWGTENGSAGALAAYFAVSANCPFDANAPLSPPKRLANPFAAPPVLKPTNNATSAPFVPQSKLVGSHWWRSSHSRIMIAQGRDQSLGQGSRPPRPAPVPRVREEGAG